ncbi:alcohol dehydrogenase catalytic domain-containing protein [Olivibacter domesticus]|uniref:S-(Hydroxymethyl)glutathione dehydrogenase / alcohol dehydrogenase n=1 Tax=Olivibacter domesticus TaxID=407022 RepID=A0A1H7LA69_OLID1|nr:alcohol dehydrogenase catalytic domain-containing protein [Olivibacter domesticus]SEK95818.1 S-(hydroxymethyl)glutathione dehydrogenase / alcohol dehydrogenase [Olivibacter domesticus]
MSIYSKAAITNGQGTFSIETIEIGDPAPDEIIVRMKAAGVCHTDFDSLNWGTPLVLGHEGAGIVEKVGQAINNFSIGDKVILNWAIPCGHCYQCAEGNLHICENHSPVCGPPGFQSSGHALPFNTLWQNKPIARSFHLGTLSEYVIVKEAAVVKNDSINMSFAAASIIGCGIMTGYGSVVNAAKVKPASSVVVLGTGGVGLSVVQSAKIAGAAMIIAIDVNENRLNLAKRFGATHTLLTNKDDKGLLKAALEVKKMTGNRGADYAFECTAVPELGAAPLAMVRNAGTAVQVSGIEQSITFDMNLFEWDKIYINPLYGKCKPHIDFPKIMQLYDSGQLLLEELISRTYSIENLSQAFKDMLTGKNAKGVIIFN